jgi:hypothetical protein
LLGRFWNHWHRGNDLPLARLRFERLRPRTTVSRCLPNQLANSETTFPQTGLPGKRGCCRYSFLQIWAGLSRTRTRFRWRQTAVGGPRMPPIRHGLHTCIGVCGLIVSSLVGVIAFAFLAGAATGTGFAGSILLGGLGIVLLFVFVFVFAVSVMYWKTSKSD